MENFDLNKIMNNELELDKDIKGGKIYSVDNCIFVDRITKEHNLSQSNISECLKKTKIDYIKVGNLREYNL